MNLRNIHNRKEYLKLYEFGGHEGGIASNDGFANNAALKDTLLGKVINGMFKGVAWLWRKSKENFVINRLIAQLINELTRAVIVFCFEKNIDLQSGEMEKSEEDNGLNSADANSVSGVTSTGATSANSGTTGTHILTLLEKIKKVETKEEYIKILPEVEKRLGDDKLKVRKIKITMQTKNSTLNSVAKERVAGIKSEIAGMEHTIEKYRIYDIKLKNAIKAKAEELGIKPPDISKKDPFEVIEKDLTQFDPENPSTKLLKNLGINITPNNITVPVDFEQIKIQAKDFLNSHIEEYKNMGDKEQVKMQNIYMSYKIMEAVEKKLLKKDSYNYEYYEFLNEESLVNSVGSALSSAGTAKVKPDDPRAGKVSLGRSLDMKVGGKSATVGDILTKRDRQKYEKDHGDDFKLDIHSINLAEIEKTIAELDNQSTTDPSEKMDVKAEVSTFVNIYNLKAIQLSAEKLFLPRKTEEGEDDNKSLKIKWNKELAKVYAAFTNLMNIKDVDISTSDFKSDLNNDKKALGKADVITGGVKLLEQVAEIENKIPIDESRSRDAISNIKGDYSFFVFSYNKKSYMTSVAPVRDQNGLIRITSCFSDVSVSGTTTNPIVTLTPNTDFNTMFKTNIKGLPNDKKNVYFLMKGGASGTQRIPRKTNNSGEKCPFVVITEINYSGTYSPYIKVKGSNYVSLDDTLMGSFDIKRFAYIGYLHDFKALKTGAALTSQWRDAFEYIKHPGFFDNTDFQTGTKPIFFGSSGSSTDTKMTGYITKIQELLKKV